MRILSKYFWRDFYRDIRDFFWPRNKWLTDRIPNSWRDKDWLIEETLSAAIIHFVDEEKGFEETVWDDTPEKLDTYHKLNSAYHWFKWQRKSLEEKEGRDFEASLLEKHSSFQEFRADLYYDFAAKKEILDNLHLKNIIKYRKHLWT